MLKQDLLPGSEPTLTGVPSSRARRATMARPRPSPLSRERSEFMNSKYSSILPASMMPRVGTSGRTAV